MAENHDYLYGVGAMVKIFFTLSGRPYVIMIMRLVKKTVNHTFVSVHIKYVCIHSPTHSLLLVILLILLKLSWKGLYISWQGLAEKSATCSHNS